MNTRLSLLTAALLLGGASSAYAASSTELTVTGFITPAACKPSLSDSDVYYGKIPAKALKLEERTHLDKVTIQLSVSCDAAAPFAIHTIDNRPNTADSTGGKFFGLGLINGTQQLGGYRMDFINPVADSAVTTITSSNEGSTWIPYVEGETKWRDWWLAFGSEISGVWTPSAVQNVTVDIELLTHIAQAKNLTLTDEVPLDGSATLEVKYL